MRVPQGFRFSAVPAGIRKDGRIDLALAVAEVDCVVAGTFTRNLVRAAPVDVAADRVRAGSARAVLVNAGCANACTGAAGRHATLETTRALAAALGVPPESVLPASTGVIGALLPAPKIVAQAARLVADACVEGWDAFSRAILTTDRWPKVVHREIPGEGGSAALLAMAKGAGMIHPDMGPPQATLLAFLFTDAVVERAVLSRALAAAVDDSFNACSVDGDTSTNDTVLAMASGRSGVVVQEPALLAALRDACTELARSMVADGEGASHAVEIRVQGLATGDDARRVARTIATSLLVKTALFGEDPNWGRLLAAAGRSGVAFDPSVARIEVDGVEIVRDGIAVGGDAEPRAAERMKRERYTIRLELGAGPGAASYLTNDLGHGYVDVNAGYRS